MYGCRFIDSNNSDTPNDQLTPVYKTLLSKVVALFTTPSIQTIKEII